MTIWIKFLKNIFLDNLNIAFKNCLFFILSKRLLKDVLKYYTPFKSERLSYLVQEDVFLSNPYFNFLMTEKTIKDWYKNLTSDRI